MKYLFLVLLSLVLSQVYVNATVKRICNVKYKTEDGWSKEYTVQVQFMTGRELKKAVKSYEYYDNDSYALIWFSEGEVAILELSTSYNSFGEDFDPEDFRKLFIYSTSIDAEQVNKKSKPKWEIIGKDYFGFIDKRVNDEL